MSSEKMDWETPENLLEVVRAVGPIELDPCTTEANPCQAERFYTPEDDGLANPWKVRKGAVIYVNPPYGREVFTWVARCAGVGVRPANPGGTRDDEGGDVIALVPARTDTTWWHAFATSADCICFWAGRLRFRGAESSAPFPSALLYWGTNPEGFRAAVDGRGWCVDKCEGWK